MLGIPDVRIKFEFNGDSRTLALVEVPLYAWSELRRSVELYPPTIMAGIEQMDLDSLAAVVWLERVVSGHEPAKFVRFRDSLAPSDELVLSGLKVGPKTLFGEFGGDEDDPPTSGTE